MARPLRWLVAPATLMVIGSAPATLPGADWPQFRGPQRDGISGETDLLDHWDASGPPELWRLPIGTGYSGIAVVGDRLYTMDADDETEFAICLMAATGEEIWRTAIGPLFTSYFGDGPRSTPTIDGDWVYVLSGRGHLAALRASDGETLWEIDYPDAFGSEIPEYGFSTSALVVDDLLIVQPGGGSGQAVAAFDKRTGERRWAAGDDTAGYSSPILIDVDGSQQLVFMTPLNLMGVSLQGEVLWSHPFAPDQDIKPAMPVFVAPDLLFFSASYDIGAIALRLEADGGSVVAREVWRDRVMRNHFNASVAIGDHLYGFDNATLKCIKATTGEELWAERGGLGKGSLLYAGGNLLVLTETGRLLVVEASPEEYRKRAGHQVLSGRCWTSPTVAGGRIFLRNRDEIVCLDLRPSDLRPTENISLDTGQRERENEP